MYHSLLCARQLGFAERVSFFLNVDVHFCGVVVSLTLQQHLIQEIAVPVLVSLSHRPFVQEW